MRRRRRVRTSARVLWAAALLCGCAHRDQERGGPMTELEKNATIREGIRRSSEGVIFLPGKRAEPVYELPRLNEIAQSLRSPAAGCFLQRALETMEPAPDTEEGFSGVPDGQVKIRTRIGPDGRVLRTEVLENGFDDEVVPQCVGRAIRQQKFPENQTGTAHYIDVVYWVSLGMNGNLRSRTTREQIRKETVKAAIRSKACFSGQVTPGSYTVEGLNLVGSNGATLANRVDQSSLPEQTRKCVARAFRDLRLPADRESFIRPVMPSVRIDVGDAGDVTVADEEWYRLVQLEERAEAAQRRADLGADATDGGDPPEPPRVEIRPEAVTDATVDPTAATEPASDPVPTEPPPTPAPRNPGQGGIKIDLGTRPGS